MEIENLWKLKNLLTHAFYLHSRPLAPTICQIIEMLSKPKVNGRFGISVYNAQFRSYSNKLSALLDHFCPLHNFRWHCRNFSYHSTTFSIVTNRCYCSVFSLPKQYTARNAIISLQPFILLLVDFNPIVYCSCMPIADLCK